MSDHQNQNAFGRFCRNRWALGASTIIGFVVVVALMCPLLANQRPLVLKSPLRTDFENALLVLLEQVGIAAEGKLPDQEIIDLQVRIMGEHLSPIDRTRLHQQIDAFKKALGEGGDGDQSMETLPSLLEEWFSVELVPVLRFPAIRALGTLELFFVLFGLVVGLRVIVRRDNIKSAILLALLMSSFGTIVARVAFPSISDERSYRSLIASEEFKRSGGFAVRALVPFGENENLMAEASQPPSWFPGAKSVVDTHWLGTDTNGRDVLARMIYGARVSMIIGVLGVGIYTLIGMFLGALAGYFRGWTDLLLSRIIEVVICFPAIMVILAAQAFLKPSLLNIVFALAILYWTGVARLQRAEFLRLADAEFVHAVRALGGSDFRIVFRHILPNAVAPILVVVGFGIAGSILIESALSFLGFGVPQPMASWGDLLNNGREDVRGLWWLTVFPGMAIFMTVTCFNLVGEGVRDALDPR